MKKSAEFSKEIAIDSNAVALQADIETLISMFSSVNVNFHRFDSQESNYMLKNKRHAVVGI